MLRTFLAMIKFEHSIFALPFAMIGMMWGSLATTGSPWPGWRIFLCILVAMVSCRTAAMAYNRVADRDIDAKNPRTRMRAIPAGLLGVNQVITYLILSCVIFFAAAASLNHLTLLLSPIALFITMFYSRTKRFTPLCHIVLGLSLGIAPAAAWIASTGRLDIPIGWVTLGVLCWTAGFDVIYALQDEEFDREHGLRSIPETLGKRKALAASRALHVGAITFLTTAGFATHSGLIYFVGVAFAACLLAYEQSLVKPDDLSRVDMAFFTLNGFVSIGVFAFTLVDVLVRR